MTKIIYFHYTLQISIPFPRISTLFVRAHQNASSRITSTVLATRSGFYVNSACCGITKVVYTTQRGEVFHRVGSAVMKQPECIWYCDTYMRTFFNLDLLELCTTQSPVTTSQY